MATMTELAKLGSQDSHALDVLRKYGELILCADGFYRASAEAYSSLGPRQIKKLAALGYCRIDKLGSAKVC